MLVKNNIQITFHGYVRYLQRALNVITDTEAETFINKVKYEGYKEKDMIKEIEKKYKINKKKVMSRIKKEINSSNISSLDKDGFEKRKFNGHMFICKFSVEQNATIFITVLDKRKFKIQEEVR